MAVKIPKYTERHIKENRVKLIAFASFAIVCAALCGIFRLFVLEHTNSDIVLLGLTILIEVGVFSMLKNLARPHLVEGGKKLHCDALKITNTWNSYFVDMFFIAGFAQLLVVFWRKGWWLLALIPGYGFFKLWQKVLKPWIFTKKEGEENNHDGPQNRKERRLMQQGKDYKQEREKPREDSFHSPCESEKSSTDDSLTPTLYDPKPSQSGMRSQGYHSQHIHDSFFPIDGGHSYSQESLKSSLFECCSQSFHDVSSQPGFSDHFNSGFGGETSFAHYQYKDDSMAKGRISAPPVASVSPFLMQDDEVTERYNRFQRWKKVVRSSSRRKRRSSEQPMIQRSCVSAIVQHESHPLLISTEKRSNSILLNSDKPSSIRKSTCGTKKSRSGRQTFEKSFKASQHSASQPNPNTPSLTFGCGFKPISSSQHNPSSSSSIDEVEACSIGSASKTSSACEQSLDAISPARPFVSTQGDHFLPSFLSLTAKLPPILSAEEGADLAADERRLADVRLQEKVSGIKKGRRSSYSLCYDLSTSFSQTNTVPAQYVPQTSINGLSDISFSAAPVLSQSQMTDSFFDIETGIADHSGVIPHSSLGTIECPEISETHLGPGETSELYKLDLCEMCSIVTSEGLAGEIVRGAEGVSFTIDPFANSGFL
ncbi:SRP-independent targeting protein 2/TMEM208 like protein [Aduncisulcus paluster]|uniref:SRP-independent targeting protein 2/TMEM208 like protein n=1 Tax=Aduncisulcus paluster TaxID=2918883 RepID=A0ABQ5K9C9_9EUKA|nr:SRP-independent targeting protein 2/TMEM208 like protein [Aduncisulcus paluster]